MTLDEIFESVKKTTKEVMSKLENADALSYDDFYNLAKRLEKNLELLLLAQTLHESEKNDDEF